MNFLMNFNWRNKWLWSGVAAYLLFLVITLPASVLSSRLAKRGITTINTQGTLWHGQVSGLQVGVLNLGDAEWNMRLLPVFTGKLGADVKLTQAKGYAQARVAVGLSGNVTLSNLSASLPLQSILGNGGLPGGWVGMAQAKFSELVLKKGWPVAAQGSLDLVDLTGPLQKPSNIGAYRVVFAPGSTSADTLTGTLTDLDGAAIAVAGTLQLKNDRSYVVDTLVAARPNTPQDITQTMQYLGTPDAQGRRPFSVSGTL